MFKRIVLTLLVYFTFSLSFAGENVDLNRLTDECIDAAKKYKTIQKDFLYKVLHTVEYEGWSGDADNFDLKFPIAMKIRYAGVEKKGYYWFLNDPKRKHHIRAKVDYAGNFELVEIAGSGANNKFYGIMKDGIIKGLWEKSNGKRSFAFYVTVKK
ncbi:MAG: hypothetical protein SVY10_03330 [Thermodesulfobacteriota bacterium]|nr:hypothetical protein [Thermodesulfobacteriota bacterium]